MSVHFSFRGYRQFFCICTSLHCWALKGPKLLDLCARMCVCMHVNVSVCVSVGVDAPGRLNVYYQNVFMYVRVLYSDLNCTLKNGLNLLGTLDVHADGCKKSWSVEACRYASARLLSELQPADSLHSKDDEQQFWCLEENLPHNRGSCKENRFGITVAGKYLPKARLLQLVSCIQCPSCWRWWQAMFMITYMIAVPTDVSGFEVGTADCRGTCCLSLLGYCWHVTHWNTVDMWLTGIGTNCKTRKKISARTIRRHLSRWLFFV